MPCQFYAVYNPAVDPIASGNEGTPTAHLHQACSCCNAPHCGVWFYLPQRCVMLYAPALGLQLLHVPPGHCPVLPVLGRGLPQPGRPCSTMALRSAECLPLHPESTSWTCKPPWLRSWLQCPSESSRHKSWAACAVHGCCQAEGLAGILECAMTARTRPVHK